MQADPGAGRFLNTAIGMRTGTCFNHRMLVSASQALRRVLEAVSPFPTEDCVIGAAHGRVLRGNVLADRAMPPFDRVTMDGYALKVASARHVSPDGTLSLNVDGPPQMAGMRPRTLVDDATDTCVEIMTGAVLPAGAECVVPYEETQRSGNVVTLSADAVRQLAAGWNIHRQGSDHPAGALLVVSGTRLTGREIAVAASCGYASVPVAALPRIGLVATGDELVEVAFPVAPHQIRRSNDAALRAALLQAGYPQIESLHLRDVPAEIERGLHRLLTSCDLVIITGGVSKGRSDHNPATLASLGVNSWFHGVSQRPGKPLWFGLSSRRTPVFALPGNPISCYTCLHQYVLPALRKASGQAPLPPTLLRLATAAEALETLTRFTPVRVMADDQGIPQAEPEPFNTSGDFAGLVGTDGYVELPPHASSYPAGHLVNFTPWV